MYITAKVLRDMSGIYDTGYNRLIPVDVQILGMVDIEDPCIPGSLKSVLRITHPEFEGWLGIDETADSLADRINVAMCCDESGGLPKLPTPVIGTPTAGVGQATVPFTGIPTPPPGVIYQAQLSSNSWYSVAGHNSGPASPIIVGGLVNGIAHKARVRATAPGWQPSDWAEAVPTVIPLSLPRAAAPTNGMVDDLMDTFSFTINPLFPNPNQYESSILGAPYVTMTGFPLSVGNIAAGVGTVLVRVKEVPGVSDASLPIINLQPFTPVQNAVFVYFMTSPNNTVPTEAYVLANAQRITVQSGGDYKIPFSNTTAEYLMVFEGANQPLKTKNAETGIAGNAFGPQGLFPAGGVPVGSLRGYISQHKTIANVATLEFNV